MLNFLAHSVLDFTARRLRQKFMNATTRPRETQHGLLFDQIRREAGTQFGAEHRFGSIRTVEDFRRHVPIMTYDTLAPYIERVALGETEALFAADPVVMFAMTSGTTSSRKLIPVTKRSLARYRHSWTLWGLGAFLDHPAQFPLAKLAFVGNHDEFRTDSGAPCGSISGLTARMQSGLVRRSYILPPESGELDDVRAKYYLVWRLGVARQVGFWASPNPSTLLNLARFGEEEGEQIVRDLHDGGLSDRWRISPACRAAIRKQLAPNPTRARELGKLLSRDGALRPREVWPELKLIGCWTGGSMSSYLRFFPEVFGDAAVRDLGLVASEGRMTIPTEDGTTAGVLDVTSTFFEFVPVGEIDSPRPIALEAHELEEDRDYFILLTSANGLYRYHISDVVRCTGWKNGTPLLAFLNKGSGISNVTGEKLTEFQVSAAMAETLGRLGAKVRSFSLAPCWDDRRPYYALFVESHELSSPGLAESVTDELDRTLRAANVEYASKRETDRLGPIEVVRLDAGTWQAWDQARLRKAGGTAEQYKHPCLISRLDFQAEIAALASAATP